MGVFAELSEGFRYPQTDSAGLLLKAAASFPPGGVQRAFRSFCEQVRSLSLGEWEELYTRTWDLNPLAAPYIGFQIWGEDYRRGGFMSLLQGAYRERGVPTEGELPDHLLPVLRYLDGANPPLPELGEALLPALQRMSATLRKRDPANPYLHLLAAVQEASAAVASAAPEEKIQ